ncbi:inner nuclear membrane protein SRC1 [Favolaschia claudopus]|uniref:Inner nuclear membrane protein SRC1 n=1 Tax=Favolaschia claudopus TaxID=2862362 RepID=A0AAW0AQX6_9AGAR
MSRLTSAQIIAQGDYLSPSFNASTLTVSQLLGVLGYHNIVYPTPYSKPKLVALFDAEIKPRASKFIKERLKAESSIASDEGITDGHTGEPLAAARKPPPVRRSSRRLSRAPSEDLEEEPPRPDPAQAAGEKARRVSHAVSEPLVRITSLLHEFLQEDSGWEDNNVFQSGAESSSPARPRPSKSARRSTGSRKTRKSVSAPPEMLPSSSPLRPKDESTFSPPQSRFEPQLPSNVMRETRLLAPKFNQPVFSPPSPPKQEINDSFDVQETDFADDGPTEDYGDEALEEEEDEEIDEADQHNTLISQRIAEGGGQLVRQPSEKLGAAGIFMRLLILLLAVASSGVAVNYKMESAPIGYCALGSDTNPTLESLRARRSAVEACNAENLTLLPDGTPCPPPALGLPQADSCTPCPTHATCNQLSIKGCDTGYLLHSHPLLFFLPPREECTPGSITEQVWRVVGDLTDGLPGLGSVGLPPRCVEDPKRKQRIGALGKAVERQLGEMRGRRDPFPENEGGEARQYGIDTDSLAEKMYGMGKHLKKQDNLLTSFSHEFDEAIQQLSEWGGVVIGEDARSGNRYIALRTAHLSWDCVIIMQLREIWRRWQSTVFGMVALLMSGLYGTRRRAQGRIEGARVAELVQEALDTLRAQDYAYHTDPLSASAPYLSSLQLRDVVLAEEHSVPARARLWAKVERIVEGNANVRANLEEVEGGDEMRVWRWVGAPSPTKAGRDD